MLPRTASLTTTAPAVTPAPGAGFAYAFPVLLGGTELMRTLRSTGAVSTSARRIANLSPVSPPWGSR